MDEVPFEDRYVPLAEVEWERSAWWWGPLTRGFQPAMHLSSLLVGLLAVLALASGVRIANLLFAPDWRPSTAEATQILSVDVAVSGTAEAAAAGYEDVLPLLPSREWLGMLADVQAGGWRFVDFGWAEFAWISFVLLWFAAILGLLGGVLARRAAVWLGARTVAGWGETLRVVFSRWQSYLWVVGMHLVGIVLLLIPVLLLGVVSRAGTLGATIAGVLLLLYIPFIWAVGRLLFGMIVGFPLSVVAISIEKKGDAFEGFSRSTAYLFQRPAVVVLCSLVVLLGGLIGEQMVYWMFVGGWYAAGGAFDLAAGELSATASRYLGYGTWLVAMLLRSYWFAFLWSAAAGVYLVARRSLDQTELDEIDSLEGPIEEQLPDIPATSQPAADSSDESKVDSTTPTSSPAAGSDDEAPQSGSRDDNEIDGSGETDEGIHRNGGNHNPDDRS